MLDLDDMKADCRARLSAKGFPTITLTDAQKQALIDAGQNPNPPMLPDIVDAVLETVFAALVTNPYPKRAGVIAPPDDDPDAGDLVGRIK